MLASGETLAKASPPTLTAPLSTLRATSRNRGWPPSSPAPDPWLSSPALGLVQPLSDLLAHFSSTLKSSHCALWNSVLGKTAKSSASSLRFPAVPAQWGPGSPRALCARVPPLSCPLTLPWRALVSLRLIIAFPGFPPTSTATFLLLFPATFSELRPPPPPPAPALHHPGGWSLARTFPLNSAQPLPCLSPQLTDVLYGSRASPSSSSSHQNLLLPPTFLLQGDASILQLQAPNPEAISDPLSHPLPPHRETLPALPSRLSCSLLLSVPQAHCFPLDYCRHLLAGHMSPGSCPNPPASVLHPADSDPFAHSHRSCILCSASEHVHLAVPSARNALQVFPGLNPLPPSGLCLNMTFPDHSV